MKIMISGIESLLADRRRHRHFRKERVPDAVFDRIIETATQSSRLIFPRLVLPGEVGVLAYRTADAVRELASDAACAYRSLLNLFDNRPGRFLMKCLMKRPDYERMNGYVLPLGREIAASLDHGEDKVLHGAPAALIFTHPIDEDPSSALIVCACAILAAEDMGLQCCLIGCLGPALAMRKPLMKKHSIPSDQIPALALALGYPAQIARKGKRKVIREAFSMAN